MDTTQLLHKFKSCTSTQLTVAELIYEWVFRSSSLPSPSLPLTSSLAQVMSMETSLNTRLTAQARASLCSWSKTIIYFHSNLRPHDEINQINAGGLANKKGPHGTQAQPSSYCDSHQTKNIRILPQYYRRKKYSKCFVIYIYTIFAPITCRMNVFTPCLLVLLVLS